MKRLLMLFLAVGALWLPACGWFEQDQVTDQISRGVSGEGQVGPVNRIENDKAAEHSVPDTHP